MRHLAHLLLRLQNIGIALDLLFYPFQRGHCRKAYESEKRGLQLPEDQR
jgi:hypothetical protein